MKTRREIPPRAILSTKNLALIGIPRLYFEAELEDYVGEEEVEKLLTRYITYIHDMFEYCVNLTFRGANGNGKTFLTSIILKNAYRHYYSAQRTTVAHYISTSWKQDKTDADFMFLERINNVEFLVIDELGKEPDTKKGNEVLLLDELMKYREEKGLPTIICTNLNMQDIEKQYGSTLVSMLKQSVQFKMEGDDMRKEVFGQRKGVSLLLGEEDDNVRK